MIFCVRGCPEYRPDSQDLEKGGRDNSYKSTPSLMATPIITKIKLQWKIYLKNMLFPLHTDASEQPVYIFHVCSSLNPDL